MICIFCKEGDCNNCINSVYYNPRKSTPCKCKHKAYWKAEKTKQYAV